MSQPARMRAEVQRDRILAAAQACFIRHGFHAAGMAAIAAEAGMSPGLIYRYFENKDAIILAIIDRQLAERRSSIDSLPVQPDWEQRIRTLFAGWQRGDDGLMNAALFLEMSAQASRDPHIAGALAAADAQTRVHFLTWLRAHARAQGAEPADAELESRSLALQAFIEGLAIRAVREPARNPDAVVDAVHRTVPTLLDFRR